MFRERNENKTFVFCVCKIRVRNGFVVYNCDGMAHNGRKMEVNKRVINTNTYSTKYGRLKKSNN